MSNTLLIYYMHYTTAIILALLFIAGWSGLSSFFQMLMPLERDRPWKGRLTFIAAVLLIIMMPSRASVAAMVAANHIESSNSLSSTTLQILKTP